MEEEFPVTPGEVRAWIAKKYGERLATLACDTNDKKSGRAGAAGAEANAEAWKLDGIALVELVNSFKTKTTGPVVEFLQKRLDNPIQLGTLMKDVSKLFQRSCLKRLRKYIHLVHSSL